MTNQYSNQDDGALDEGLSSESEVQLPDEHAALLSKLESAIDRRLDQKLANIPSAISNGFRGVQGLVDGISARVLAAEERLGEVLTRSEIAERLLAQGYDKEVIDQVNTQVKQERKIAELERQQAQTPQVKQDEPSDSQMANYWQGRYAQHHEPDILQDAFDEGLISTVEAEALSAAEKTLLKRLIPGLPANSWREVTEDMYLEIKRQARKSFKAEADRKVQQEKRSPAVPSNRQTAGATGRKFTRSDIEQMSPEEYAQNRDAIFAQMTR